MNLSELPSNSDELGNIPGSSSDELFTLPAYSFADVPSGDNMFPSGSSFFTDPTQPLELTDFAPTDKSFLSPSLPQPEKLTGFFESSRFRIEQEEATDPVVAREGRSFTPFHISEALIGKRDFPEEEEIVSRQVTLQLNGTLQNGQELPELQFQFSAAFCRAERYAGLTPFDWEHGFPIEAGYNSQLREEVIKELAGQKIDTTKAPLGFKAAFVSLQGGYENEVIRSTGNPLSFSPEAIAYLKGLRLHLSFGTGRTLAAKPELFFLEHGVLKFDYFFDADRGAFDGNGSTLDYQDEAGLPVYLPPISALEDISPDEHQAQPERKPHPLLENVKATFVHLNEPPSDSRW